MRLMTSEARFERADQVSTQKRCTIILLSILLYRQKNPTIYARTIRYNCTTIVFRDYLPLRVFQLGKLSYCPDPPLSGGRK